MKNSFGVVVQPGSSRDQKMTGWRIYRPGFLQKDCIGCRSCELCCPDGAVYRIDKKKYDVDLDACKGCGICAEMCPVDDIVMELEEEPRRAVGTHAGEGHPGPIDSAAAGAGAGEARGGAEDDGKEPGDAPHA